MTFLQKLNAEFDLLAAKEAQVERVRAKLPANVALEPNGSSFVLSKGAAQVRVSLDALEKELL